MKPLLSLLLAAAMAGADETTATFRVIGLFSKDRETDLRAVLEKLPEVRLVSIDFDHAEAVFAYDPAIAFKDTKPEKIIESFDQKLRGASSSTFGIQPLITTPRDQLARIEIPIAVLDCKACCLVAYEAICKIDGVAQATASSKEGRVTALIDPAKTNQAALETALEKKEVKRKAP